MYYYEYSNMLEVYAPVFMYVIYNKNQIKIS